MTEYRYDFPDIATFSTLESALAARGITGADITLTPDYLKISTDDGSGVVIDSAVADASPAALFAKKLLKYSEVEKKTTSLLRKGVESWVSGKYVEINKSITDEYISDSNYYRHHPEELNPNTPYIIVAINNGPVATTDPEDIDTLVENCVRRLQYLYTAANNTDGSKSQLGLYQEIMASPDEAVLNAITDTRK